MSIEEKNKRLVNIEIEEDVKRLTIEGVDKDDQVVMKQELSDDELDGVAGGGGSHNGSDFVNRGKQDACNNVAEFSNYGIITKHE